VRAGRCHRASGGRRMNIANWLDASGRRTPDAPALFYGTELYADYRGFAARARRIGEGLARTHGIGEGDRVAIFLKNCPEVLELIFGIWWIGAMAMPINAKLHAKEVAFILGDSGADLLVSDSGDVGDQAGRTDCPEIALGGTC